MEQNKDIFDHIKPLKTEVPDAAYFQAMAAKIIQDEKSATKVVPLYKRPLVWVGAAAAIAVIALLLVNFNNNAAPASSDPLLALNELTNEEIMAYINENIDDFDTDMIVDAISSDKLDSNEVIDVVTDESINSMKKESTSGKPIPVSLDELDADDILDYFKEEGIDLEDFDEDDIFI